MKTSAGIGAGIGAKIGQEHAGTVAGLVLAGGQGRRMGGADKALLSLGGRPLLGHVLDRFAPQVGALALSANGAGARFADFGLPVLPDAPAHRGDGPLAGLIAGLDWAAAQGAGWLATVSCDMPFLPADLVARLAAAAGGRAVMAASGGRLHPTAALWPVAARAIVAARFAGGERRLRAALEAPGVADFAELPDPFTNINTPADLTTAEARLGGRDG